MARNHADGPVLFRVKIVNHFIWSGGDRKGEPGTGTRYLGPYQGLPTARTQAARESHNYTRDPIPNVVVTIERCKPTWEELE
jgi:hypothetical protein